MCILYKAKVSSAKYSLASTLDVDLRIFAYVSLPRYRSNHQPTTLRQFPNSLSSADRRACGFCNDGAMLFKCQTRLPSPPLFLDVSLLKWSAEIHGYTHLEASITVRQSVTSANDVDIYPFRSRLYELPARHACKMQIFFSLSLTKCVSVRHRPSVLGERERIRRLICIRSRYGQKNRAKLRERDKHTHSPN